VREVLFYSSHLRIMGNSAIKNSGAKAPTKSARGGRKHDEKKTEQSVSDNGIHSIIFNN
jgi:hypothetical protein